jgi:hypothetical protein
MFLTDLLPTLFDGVVLRLTRRPLLALERDGILTALANSVGESVMRRVRSQSTRDIVYPGEIGEITTKDRFSDDWVSRTEIIEAMARSSGLDRELSEFALFLIENGVDRLGPNGGSIVEIGRIYPAEARSEPEGDPLARLLYQLSDWNERSFELGWGSFSWRAPRSRHRNVVEISQMAAAFRVPRSYSITLSDGLAFRKNVFSRTLVILRPPAANEEASRSV